MLLLCDFLRIEDDKLLHFKNRFLFFFPQIARAIGVLTSSVSFGAWVLVPLQGAFAEGSVPFWGWVPVLQGAPHAIWLLPWPDNSFFARVVSGGVSGR